MRQRMENRSLGVVCAFRGMLVVGILLGLTGCGAGYKRGPAVPEELGDFAKIPGIARARGWGDEPPTYTRAWLSMSREELKEDHAGIMDTEHTYLAVSGGGSKGAFAAGLLVGWTQAGTRPEFTMVTGISTGALIAPFAFLGPDYDEKLTEIYTSYSTKDMIQKRNILHMLNSDAAADTRPLQALLRGYYNAGLVAAVAAEYRRGRALLVGTVNLDASRPVIWNMGRIAASGHPQAVELFQDVIIASAAIPAAFPPVFFDVEVDGEPYQEMHVDGGAIQQMFLYPAGLDWPLVTQKLGVKGKPKLYMIRNSRMLPTWKEVKSSTLSIAARATGALYRSQSIGDLYRLYVNAVNDGMDYNLAYIPEEFKVEEKETFDREFMRALYAQGFHMGKEGYEWLKEPPEIIVPN